jgi:CRISPR-associated protein Cst2
LGRIGYNDITQQYAISEQERQRRAQAVLQSVAHTFVELNGAMRTTQLPHLVGLEGALSWSRSMATPAPLLSPLMDGYREETKRVADSLGDASAVQNFDSLGDFAEWMGQQAKEAVPASLVPSHS